ncbi:WD40 repeat-containing protein, putative [Bodo saltans]|uniref:WD40 repeat-containing protein, putative n=1 Tax=Bodo saltans TaxID=75058 RepID=A0A0S4JLI8_BODSA|nr:WD40 repeat-containing protein, putative [Bodo saltans]|eukprot:CUG89966.1 WD40 repeat-containing protein, putative [Bodo saltans]
MSRTPSQQTTTALYQSAQHQHQQLGSYAYDAVATHSVEGSVRCIEMATDRTAWTAEADGCIRVRQLPTGAIVKTIESKGKSIFCNAILLVEGKIWAAYSDGFIRRYDAKSASLEREVVQHDGAVYALLYAAGRVYSGGADWKVYQWNPSSCEYQRLFFGHSNSVRCLASLNTSHGLLLFSGSDDGTIRAWDPHAPLQSTKDVACIHIFKQHTRSVLALEAVPSRKQLWSGSEDHTIRVWNTDSFQCSAVLDRHRAPVASLAFVSTRVWSGGKDGTLFLWDAKTLTAIQTIQEGIHVSSRYVMSIKRLYRAHYYKLWTSTSDGFIQCWNADSDGADEDGFELTSADDDVARRRDTARIEGLQAALYEHGAMLNEKEDEVKSLQHRIAQLKDPHQNPDLLGLSHQISALNSDLDEAAVQREQLTQRCTMADELLRATRQRLKDSEGQRREAETDRDRMKVLLESSARELVELKSTREAYLRLEDEKAMLQLRNSQLEQDAAEMQQTIQHLEDAVRSHQHIFAENGRLRHEVEVLETSIAAAERRNTELIVRGGGGAALRSGAATPGGKSASPAPRGGRGGRGGQGTASRSPSATKPKKLPRSNSASSRRHELDTTDDDEAEALLDDQGEELSLIPTTDDEAPVPRAKAPSASQQRGGADNVTDSASASSRLHERLENLRIENESLMQQLGAQQASYEQELDTLQKRISQVQEQQEKDLQLAAAHEKLKRESSKTIGELRASLKMSQAEASSRTHQLSQLQEETEGSSDSYRKDLNKKEKQLIDLRDALAKAQHALDDARKESEEQTVALQQEKELLKRQVVDARREKDRVVAEAAAIAQRHQASPYAASDDGTSSSSPETLRRRLHDTQRDLENAHKELRLQKVNETRTASEIHLLREELTHVRSERALTFPTPSKVDASPARSARSLSGSPAKATSVKQRKSSPGGSHPPHHVDDDEYGAQTQSIPSSPTSAHTGTLGELSITLVQLRNENDALKGSQLAAESAMKQAIREAEVSRQELEAATKKLAELEERQVSQGSALQEALDFLQSEKERYDALHETYESMSSALLLAEERENAYEGRVESSLEEIEALKGTIKRLEAEKETVAQAADERRVRVPSPVSPAHIGNVSTNVTGDGYYTPEGSEALHHIIEELEEALEKKQVAVEESTEELAMLEDRFNTVTDDLVFFFSLHHIIEELEEALEKKQVALEESTEELAMLEDRFNTVTDDLVKCISQRRAAEEQNIVLQASLDAQREDAVKLQRDVAVAQEHAQRCQRETATLQLTADGAVSQLREQLSEALAAADQHRAATTVASDKLKKVEVAHRETTTALAHMAQDNRELTTKLELLTLAQEQLESDVSSLRSVRAALQTERDTVAAQLAEATLTATRDLRDATATCTTLRRSLETEQEQLAATKATLENREKSVQRLQGEAEALREALRLSDERLHETGKSYEQRITTLQSQLTAAEDAIDELHHTIEQTARDHVNASETALTDLQIESDRKLREYQQAAKVDASALRNVLETSEDNRRKAERALVSKEVELADSLARVSILESRCGTLERELQDALQQVQHAKAASQDNLRALHKDVDRLTEQLHRCEMTLELRDKQNECLTADLRQEKERTELVQSRSEDQLTRATERGLANEKELAQLQRTTLDNKVTIDGLRHELDTTVRQLEREAEGHAATSALLAGAHSTVTSQAESIAVLTQENERLQMQRDEWQAEASTLGNERLTLAMQHDALQQELKQLRLAHEDMTIQLKREVKLADEQSREIAALASRLVIAEEAASDLKLLTETHHSTVALLAARDESVAVLARQQDHWKVYTEELEGSIEVLKRSLKERSEQLVDLEHQEQLLRDRIALLEQSDGKQRHRIQEADREHAELVRLREVCSDNAGAADAAYQEQKILADQLSVAEDQNEKLAALLQAAEERLMALTGAPESIASLTQQRNDLQAENQRLESELSKKTDEALDGLRSEDRANQLAIRVENLLADIHRLREEQSSSVEHLENVVAEQERRLFANATAADRRTRELTAAEERLREAATEASAASDARREAAQLRRELTAAEHLVQQLQHEQVALKKRLAATGPLSQIEVEQSVKNLEAVNKSQQEQLRQQEIATERLHECVKADQALLSLAISEANLSVASEQLIRELADTKAKVHALQSSLTSAQQNVDFKEQTNAELRQRLRMLETMFFRPSAASHNNNSSSPLPNPSSVYGPPRGDSVEPAALYEDESNMSSMNAAAVAGGGGAIRSSDEDHLVPTPAPTPRGVSLASGVAAANSEPRDRGALVALRPTPLHDAHPTTTTNPALLKAYTEHLSTALERSTELCEQLQRVALQRSEGQRLLAERLSAVRSAAINGSSGSTLGALVDEANNYRVAMLEATLHAYKSRLESLQTKLRSDTQADALAVLRERDGGAAVDALHQLLQDQSASLESLKEERDRSRLDAQQRSMTIAALVQYLHVQRRSHAAAVATTVDTNTAEQQQPSSVPSLEVALALERHQSQELRTRITELNATVVQLQTAGGTTAEGVADALIRLANEGELMEEKLFLSEQLVQRQAVELAQCLEHLANAHDETRIKATLCATSEEATAAALRKLDAANHNMAELHAVVEGYEAKISQQEVALQVRQKRREELLHWIKSTPQLRETMSTLSDQEAFDTLTVCRHLHRLLLQAQTDAHERAAKDARKAEASVMEAKDHECALLRDRVEQLVHDVRCALDDAELWKQRFDANTEGRHEAVQRAARSEAAMLSLEATLEMEQQKYQEAQRTIADLAAHNTSKDDLMESMQQRIHALDERVRDLQVDLELKGVEVSTKQATINGLTEEMDLIYSTQKRLEARCQESETRALTAEDALVSAEDERDAAKSQAQHASAALRGMEERYHIELQSHDAVRDRLEGQLLSLRKENGRIAELTQSTHEALAKADHHEREEKSLMKRLAIAQELNHHLKEQNSALERSRADAAQLRLRLGGNTAVDTVTMRRLCIEVFKCLPGNAEDRTVMGYAAALESHAAQLEEERVQFVEVYRLLDAVTADLSSARRASSTISVDVDRGSLSLTPTPSEAGCSEPSSRSISPATNEQQVQQSPEHSAAGLASSLERVLSATRAVCTHHRFMAEHMSNQRSRMMHLADQNKRLSEEVEILSHKLKHASTKLLRSENSEQLLTYVEPSRDIAVRALFHLREHVNDMKIHVTMLQGTTAQTREHWPELYQQLTSQIEPLRGLLQQGQVHLSHAFEKCLTAQEKEEVLGAAAPPPTPPLGHIISEASSRSHTPRQLYLGGSGRVTPDQDVELAHSRAPKPTPPPTPVVVTTPRQATSSAIVGRGGESTIANRDIVARGIQEARRRGQAWSDRD